MTYGYRSREPMSAKAKWSIYGGVLFVVFLLVSIIGACSCSHYETGPGEVAIHRSGGIFLPVDEEILGCIDPSSNGYQGFGEKYVVYPATDRDFTFNDSGNEDVEAPAFEVVVPNSTDPIETGNTGTTQMWVSGFATFTLNTECDTLMQFDRDIGLKFAADTDDGWKRMLNLYIKQPLQKALDLASKEFAANKVYANAETQRAWEARAGELMSEQINEVTGGEDYFCGPDYEPGGECGPIQLTLQAPDISEDLSKSIEQQQIATQENLAAKKQNETLRTEAQGFADALKQCGCSPQEYNQWLAIQKGIAILPNGVLVDTGAGTSSTPESNNGQ